MASNKTVAAAFAAGLAAGGGVGVQIDEDKPAVAQYVGYAVESGITDVLEKRLIPDRAGQMVTVAEDIREDLQPGESVELRKLSLKLAEKIDTQDWLVWYNHNLVLHLNEQIKLGQAQGNLTPTQTVLLADVADEIERSAKPYIPQMSAEAAASIRDGQEYMVGIQEELRKR